MFSQTIIDLARRFNEVGDNDFALHDALLEEGFPDLAKHFRQGFPHCGNGTYCAHAQAIATKCYEALEDLPDVRRRMIP